MIFVLRHYGEGRKTKIAGVVSIILLGVTAISAPLGAAEAADNYVPDELIVKFRSPTAETLEHQLQLGHPPGKLLLSPRLEELLSRYRAREIRPLCRGFRKHRRRVQALKQKRPHLLSRRERHLLRRLARAPKDAKVPDLGRIYKLRLSPEPGRSLQQVREAFASCPEVEYADLNYIVTICREPNDPLYPIQWSLHNVGQMYPASGRFKLPPGDYDKDVDAPQAWEFSTGSSEVIVAVLDSGLDYTHRDIDDNVWVNEAEANGLPGVDDDLNDYFDDVYGYDFHNNDPDPRDDNGHGTHVSGIIAAEGDNGLDIAGVCWNARIMSTKFIAANGKGSVGNAIEAVYYAVDNGADILSNSWSGLPPPGLIIPLEEAFEYAYSQGVISVASAGNGSSTEPLLPAAFDTVISVAATDSNDEKAIFSNYGNKIDIAAPGVDILSLRAYGIVKGTIYDDYTTILSGTSMSCPYVSAAFAMMLSKYPDLDILEAKEIVMETVDYINPDVCKSGRLNLYRAVKTVADFFRGIVVFTSDLYSCSDAVRVILNDLDLAGNGTWDVPLATSAGDFEILTLIEANSLPGAFTNSILASSGEPAPQNGLLELTHGEVITVTYEDEDDGTGKPAISTDAARADCQPPEIFDVTIDPVGPEPNVSFRTDERTASYALLALSCGGPYVIEQFGSGYFTSHTIKLDDVAPYTTYFVTIRVRDVVGNETIDDRHGRCYKLTTTGPANMYVPRAYPTIQDAINVAWDDSIVWVADGVHTGEGNLDIDFLSKALVVRSENGPDNCIIDCRGTAEEPHCAFLFVREEDHNSVVSGFTIINGYSSLSYRGGGITCYRSSPRISNCVLFGNEAAFGGAIRCTDSSAFIDNCIIAGNRAFRGGGIACQRSDVTIGNCTLSGNYASGTAPALFWRGGTQTVTNCIIWDNFGLVSSELFLSDEPTYSCMDNWAGGGQGNISTDPCFVQPGYWADANDTGSRVEPNHPYAVWVPGDYRLLQQSMCIDAGDPNFSNEPDSRDIEGQPRVFGGRVDIGADEYMPLIEVSMKLSPRSLNLGSKGKWVKARLVLPQGFVVEDVDVNSPALLDFYIESHSLQAYLNEAGRVEVEAIFARWDVCMAFPHDGAAEMMVVGRLTDGRYFAGTQRVRIANRTFEQLFSLAEHWLVSDCDHPKWCEGLDVNRDSVVNFLDFALFEPCCYEAAGSSR